VKEKDFVRIYINSLHGETFMHLAAQFRADPSSPSYPKTLADAQSYFTRQWEGLKAYIRTAPAAAQPKRSARAHEEEPTTGSVEAVAAKVANISIAKPPQQKAPTEAAKPPKNKKKATKNPAKAEAKPEVRHGHAAVELRDEFADDVDVDSFDEYDLIANAFVSAASIDAKTAGSDFILDTGANTTVVNRPDALVQDVHHSRVTLNGLEGPGTSTTLMGQTENFGEGVLKSSSPFNLVSASGLKKAGYKIKLNEDATIFTATKGDKCFVFQEQDDGLYHLDRRHDCTRFETLEAHVIMTTKQRERAVEARKLHCALGHPGDDALIAKLDNGGIINCPLTGKDVRAAKALLGPCTICQIGKTTNAPSINLASPTPSAPGDLVHVDIIYVRRGRRKSSFLIAVDDVSGHISTFALADKKKDTVSNAVGLVKKSYASLGLEIRKVRCDHEAVFTAVESDLQGIGIEVQFARPGQHAKVAERATRTLKERHRCSILGQRYRMPARLWNLAIADATRCLNQTPNKKCWPHSPNDFIGRDKTVYGADTNSHFGKVALFKVPSQPSSSSDGDSRLESGIVVGKERSNGNTVVFLIATRQLVVRGAPIDTPLTDQLIQAINDIAADDDELDDTAEAEFDWATGDDKHLNDVEQEPHSPLDPAVESWTPHVLAPPTVPQEMPPIPNLQQLQSSPAPDVNLEAAATDLALADEPAATSEPVGATTHAADEATPATQEENATTDEPSAAPAAPKHGYNLRPERSDWKRYDYNVSLLKAIKMDRPKALTAAEAEVRQLLARDVWQPVTSVPKGQRLIYSSMFLKEKYDAAGTFDKYKARLVAGGDAVEADAYNRGETSSPTVYVDSMMLILSIAAHQDMHLATIDFPGAYLYATLEKSHYMRLSPEVADLVRQSGDYEKYVRRDGSMIVKLRSALYGLPESGALWYRRVCASLRDLGFSPTSTDPCVFTRRNAAGQAIIALYVDDILLAVSSSKHREEVIEEVKGAYPDVKSSVGNSLSFLGMLIQKEGTVITVGQPAYVDTIVSQHDVSESPTTPATKSFLETPADVPADMKLYASLVMKLMYIALRTRPDILFAVTYLASKAKRPTSSDLQRALRVVGYLRGTRDFGLTLSPNNTQLHASVDASHAIHDDGKGHSGTAIGIGGTYFSFRSKKQKLVSASSTESELNALFDASKPIMWVRDLLEDLGYPQTAADVQQDNMSAITVANQAYSRSGRSRHMFIRCQYVKELIDHGKLKLTYTSTKEIVADALTKPVTGKLFQETRSALLNGNLNAL
jgi:hypothetical protein